MSDIGVDAKIDVPACPHDTHSVDGRSQASGAVYLRRPPRSRLAPAVAVHT